MLTSSEVVRHAAENQPVEWHPTRRPTGPHPPVSHGNSAIARRPPGGWKECRATDVSAWVMAAVVDRTNHGRADDAVEDLPPLTIPPAGHHRIPHHQMISRPTSPNVHVPRQPPRANPHTPHSPAPSPDKPRTRVTRSRSADISNAPHAPCGDHYPSNVAP